MSIYTGEQLGKTVELEYLGKIKKEKKFSGVDHGEKEKFIDVIIDDLLKKDNKKLTADDLKKRPGDVCSYYKRTAETLYAKCEVQKLRNFFDFNNEETQKRILEIVKEAQPFSDPSDPYPDFANDLQATIVAKLGLDYSDVKFYTAIDSCIDGLGIDGFFEISKPGFKPENVFFDLTIDTEEAKIEKCSGSYGIILSLYPKSDSGYNAKVERGFLEKFSDIIIKNLDYKLEKQKLEEEKNIKKEMQYS